MTAKQTESNQTLRQRAEEELNSGAATTPKVLSLDEANLLLHELRVHQIELEMQNEELRRTQVELDVTRARYFDLYDLAPVGYCTLSEQGLILEANLTAATLLGVARSALVKQPLSRFILSEDQDLYYKHRKQVFEAHFAGSGQAGAPQSCELRMVKKDGTSFWARLEATAAQDSDGAPVCRVVLSDITERKRTEQVLRTSLAEKEVLLKEIHHRVKNNLASISAFISLQQDRFTDPAVVAEFNELIGRVQSIALVHELLYQTKTLSQIDMHDYLETLVARLHHSYRSPAVIRSSVAAAGVTMNLDSAIPCGLIVNELVTNAFKFAFPEGRPRPGEQECEIAVTAAWDGSAYTLTVRDNGVGLPADLDWRATQSLGLQLVVMFGKYQLNGQIELDRSGGTTFRLRFAPKNHNGS